MEFYMKQVCIAWPLTETFSDYPDPRACAVAVYMTGCDHNCPGCQNPELKSHDGLDMDAFLWRSVSDLEKDIADACEKYRTNCVVLLGGDPLAACNRDVTRELLRRIGKRYTICLYTGYDIAFIQSQNLSGFTYVKTGKFHEHEKQLSGKTDTLMRLASSNQTIYDRHFKRISHNGTLTFRKVS